MERFEYACISEQGMRDNNEDLCVASVLGEGQALFVCIDGVGGEEGGEMAAAIAADTIRSYFSEMENIKLDDLKMSVVMANNNIIDMQHNPLLRHMSCVLTACIIDTAAGLLHICHVGDTRLYVLGDAGPIRKITPDHSWVGRLLDNGLITEEEARTHKRRNIINRALGMQRLDFFTEYLYSETIKLKGVRHILLCSDGLYDAVPSQKIQSILEQGNNPGEITKTFVETALRMGSHDNISAITIILNENE